MKYINNLEPVIEGLNNAADIITSTMGAEGKTVAISEDGKLRFTKDGVSVARNISFDDEFENIGAKILISAANETVKAVGDGTTLTSLLLQKLITSTNLDSDNINAELSKIKKDLDLVKEQVLDVKKDVQTIDEIRNIASVSASSDKIGELFAQLYEEASFDSLIKLETSQYNNKSYYEVLKGVEYTGGYIHPSFRTDREVERCVHEDAMIVLSKNPITSTNDKYSLLIGEAHKEDVPIVIFAPGFSDAFIRRASMVKVNQDVRVCLVKLPGDSTHAINKNFDDIQAFLSEDGYVDKIVITPYTTTFYNEDTPYLEDRLNQLRALKENAVEWWEEVDYEDRLHKLKGSSAIIYAGGRTQEEKSEEFDRLEDAIGATQSAIRNGYVPGGGYTMFTSTPKTKTVKFLVKTPLLKILENSNCKVDIKQIQEKVSQGYLYNVKTEKWEKADESSILDPADVIIEAIDNAFSNTRLIVNTSFVINK